MRITSAGNVGIGTAAPGAKLDVAGSIRSTSGNITVADGGALGWGSTSAYVGGSSASNFVNVVTSSAERMRITSAGLVGIGTSSPAVPLHISSATPAIRLTDTDDNSDAQVGAAAGGLLVLDADIGNEAAGTAILFRVDGGSEKMRITSSGNVGIGTAAPAQKLDVVGSVAVSGTIVLNTTPISGFTQVGTETSYSQVAIVGDTVDQIAIAGSKVNGFKTVHNFGSAATTGGRHGIYGVLIQDAETSATNTDRNYVGVQGQVISAVGDGGTAATMAGGKGAYFGMSSIASISSGATNLLNVTGAEINTRVLTGASAGYISGLQIVTKDEVNGGDYDTALAISKGGTGTVGKDTGILFGDMNGSHPVNSTGTLIETTGSATVAKGIDFTSYTFTGDVLSATNVGFKSDAIRATGSNAIIELGSLSASNTPAVDFHSSGNNIDHDARIICSGGTGVLGNGVLGVVAAALRPQPDNTTALGGASNRWTEVFAVAGTINTSDEREKQDIASLDESELRVATAIKGLIKKFRWKHAVERKGDAARIHVGVIAQEVEAAFEAEGLNGFDYGVLCYDEWDEELDGHGNVMVSAGNRYGIRYDELLAFVISAL